MAALTKDRDTKARPGDLRSFPVAATAVLFTGALAAVNASGLVLPMATATGLRGVGRCERRADNSAGADGEILAQIGAGIYRFTNSAGADEITKADIGQPCYGVDDQTVAKTDGTGTRSVAGEVYDVDAFGVWVKFS